MRSPLKHALLTALAIAVFWPAVASAVLVVPMTFEELVDEAAAVVYARVADVDAQWTADRQSIRSMVRLEPLRYLKGNMGSSLSLQLPGGEAAGRRQVIVGAPVLKTGDLIVVFVKARGPAVLTPLGFTQGVFHVTRHDRSGQMLVRPPRLKDSVMGAALRAAAQRGALNLDALADAVRRAEQQ